MEALKKPVFVRFMDVYPVMILLFIITMLFKAQNGLFSPVLLYGWINTHPMCREAQNSLFCLLFDMCHFRHGWIRRRISRSMKVYPCNRIAELSQMGRDWYRANMEGTAPQSIAERKRDENRSEGAEHPQSEAERGEALRSFGEKRGFGTGALGLITEKSKPKTKLHQKPNTITHNIKFFDFPPIGRNSRLTYLAIV